mmetsp:Transcript_8657/g.22396  ORF Transcript_8657/g.22396 Transcript_8657/m.22396 type:complete len:103 (-) Transcript_8657:84-392(-)
MRPVEARALTGDGGGDARSVGETGSVLARSIWSDVDSKRRSGATPCDEETLEAEELQRPSSSEHTQSSAWSFRHNIFSARSSQSCPTVATPTHRDVGSEGTH